MRMAEKFTEIGNKIVKSTDLQISLDFVPTSDFEMSGTVLSEIDMVERILFFSDKCG